MPKQRVSEPPPAPTGLGTPAASASALNPAASSWAGSVQSEGEVALQTALAVIDDKKERKVRVLFDSGSQKSFITARAVHELGLDTVRSENLGIRAFGVNEADCELRDVVQCRVSNVKGGQGVDIECYVVPEITNIANVHIEIVKMDYPYLKKLYFSDVDRTQEDLECHILIGSNFIWEFQKGQTIRGGPNEPVAVQTTLGWVLSGPLKGRKANSSDTQVNFVQSSIKQEKMELEERVSKLWDLDSLGIRESHEVHEQLLDNISFTGERYSVGLPWKVGHNELPDNYDRCYYRLQTLLKRLRSDPDILGKYDEIIREQEKAGIIQRVTNLEPVKQSHYLPHRAVVREDAETTKVRVVFDASCKGSRNGTSLNDCLHIGPPLTPLILEILLRFRANKVALIADIEKAFLNIEIDANDRDCLRFLWIDDIKSKTPEIEVFKCNRVVFGVNSSPFILNAVLRHHIESFNDIDPEFVKKLLESFFVDDLVTGMDSTEGAFQLYQKAKERLKQGGFTLRKWKSNREDLIDEIQAKEKSMQLEQPERNNSEIQDSFATETLEGNAIGKDSNHTKVLGIGWDRKSDTLEVNLGKVSEENLNSSVPTKRIILSTLASIFDPLGLVSPVLVGPKVLFQEMCIGKLDWDEPLPEDKLSSWYEWVDDLEKVGKIEIPRYYSHDVEGEALYYTLHGFGDASSKAYSAVIYLVAHTNQGIFPRLVASKTRIAPLKKLTINRLELMSAKILVVLMNTIKNALGSQIDIRETRYWLDSQTALYWLNNRGEWKQFVKNRVNEILLLSSKAEWGHVSGVDNPADLGSRGVKASIIKSNRLWWEGPAWIKEGEAAWPKFNELEVSVSVEDERKKVNALCVQTEEIKSISKVIDAKRFSSLSKLLRVTALILRFVENIKNSKVRKLIPDNPISVAEIAMAEKLWILDAQNYLKGNPDFPKVKESLGIIEQDKLLVCQGRLENSDLVSETRYPIILPKDHKFTELVILMCHCSVRHLKVNPTLTEFRSRFWVTKGRQYVKKLIRKCLICKMHDGKPFSPPSIAPLPDFRVSEAPPFTHVGVDFAGPLYAKEKGGKMNKCYFVIFSCCVTRAVHLELVSDLTAVTFLNVLSKFCARRGIPQLIVSDNAKTFKNVANLIKSIYKDQSFQNSLSTKGIRWKFNLERASWWGGHFERLIGTVKRCLRKVIGKAKLTFLELEVILLEVESTLNSRPLTYNYDEIGEEPLTPSHLLHGRRIAHLFSDVEFKSDVDNFDKLTKRFSYLSSKLAHFWKRWRTEYLVGLRERHKLQNRNQVVIGKGDVVLIEEDKVKRGFWKIGRVEQLIIGKDGVVRGAKVRKLVKGKPDYISRPVQKLYPLELFVNSEPEKKGKNDTCGTEKVMENETVTEMETEMETETETETETGIEKEMKKGKKEKAMERQHAANRAPRRAAFREASTRTKLMLDYS